MASGRYTLPVYEIYKVGQDLHWIDGLSFFGDFGLRLSVIPHWNNNDGGQELGHQPLLHGAGALQRVVSDTAVGRDGSGH